MQNNVTYLSRKLQRSLDNNYNVIDMPAVIEIISTLEKTSVTKELLETTRLGKYINELRRKTSNESLAKRAKELLKKWRDLILPDANGQIRASSAASIVDQQQQQQQHQHQDNSPKNNAASTNITKKRPASSTPPDTGGGGGTNRLSTKKLLLNGNQSLNRGAVGGVEYDFSDNSNCSIKELKKTDVIFINSDSNSSMPESSSTTPLPPHQHHHFLDVSNDATTTDSTTTAGNVANTQPKKRGRKKGSKNHKNLVIAAEESFTNKMAVSRNSKVKTTQELLADIQNRKPSTQQDIELRTAQLTESLSRIEHKLNPQKTLLNKKSSTTSTTIVNTIGGGGGVSDEDEDDDDEIVDVVGTDPPAPSITSIHSSHSSLMKQEAAPFGKLAAADKLAAANSPLTIENLLKQLPQIDKACLEVQEEMPVCECPTPKVTQPQLMMEQQQSEEKITVQIVDSSKESLFAPPSSPPTPVAAAAAATSETTDERTSVCDDNSKCDDLDDDVDDYEENLLCPAKLYLSNKYQLDCSRNDTSKVCALHEKFLPNVNGNFGAAATLQLQTTSPRNDDDTIVPNFMSERLNKPNENFQKYSISISDDGGVVERPCDCDSERTNILQNKDDDDDDVAAASTVSTATDRDGDVGPPSSTSIPIITDDLRDFREWHETLDVISYNEELLRILPYVIID